MQEYQRVCPNCGTSNPMSRERCIKCGTNLVSLPAPRGESRVSRVEHPGRALVLGASVLLARAGFELFRRALLPGAIKMVENALTPQDPKVIDVRPPKPQEEESPDYVVRGWRVWSTRHGADTSSGSESFEWRIKRK